MPVYQFQCQECDEQFEALLPAEEDGKALFCPECAAKAPRKLAPVLAGAADGEPRTPR